jgi:hypothetical protein
MPHFEAGWSTGVDAKCATGALVFVDDGHPLVGETHDAPFLEIVGVWGGSISVMARLSANRVTAVSSVAADTGRILHAARRFASYAHFRSNAKQATSSDLLICPSD